MSDVLNCLETELKRLADEAIAAGKALNTKKPAVTYHTMWDHLKYSFQLRAEQAQKENRPVMREVSTAMIEIMEECENEFTLVDIKRADLKDGDAIWIVEHRTYDKNGTLDCTTAFAATTESIGKEFMQQNSDWDKNSDWWWTMYKEPVNIDICKLDGFDNELCYYSRDGVPIDDVNEYLRGAEGCVL